MPKIPEINKITDVKFPAYQYKVLSNNVPIYIVPSKTLSVIKLELVFIGGRVAEKKKLVSRVTAGMMNESTKSTEAKDIAETVDFYGGRMAVTSNMDTTTAKLFCLTKHFEKLLNIFVELISEPKFDQKELDTMIKNQKQRLQLSLEENDVVAYREITEMMFGSHHPYGYNSSESEYESIERDDLIDYFNENITKENCHVIASGDIGDKEFDLIDKILSDKLKKSGFIINHDLETSNEVVENRNIFHLRENSVQTAIRMGMPTINRRHPDYAGMYYLNTILGGYFGARLMQNIRENKGYTYNIASSLNAMAHGGFFNIGCEVSHEHKEATQTEIKNEITRLKEELVSAEEMELVHNFMMGELLKWIDGVFNTADIIKHLLVHKLEITEFDRFARSLQDITPEDIRQLANKYFTDESFCTVIVGK